MGWRTRVSREQRVALLEEVPELVQSSSKRRRMIPLVLMPSCTRLSRRAATRERTTMDARGATTGDARTGRGGRSTTKEDWGAAALTEISSNAMRRHRLHHKLPCQYKLGKCQSYVSHVRGRYLDFLFS